jgi:hypothetical protein
MRGEKLGGSSPVWQILALDGSRWTCDAAAWPDYRTG